MSKEIEIAANIFLQWIEHPDDLAKIDALKRVFFTLKETCSSSADIEKKLVSIVNRLSFYINLVKFDQEKFIAIIQQWFSESESTVNRSISYEFQFGFRLPRIIQERIEHIQKIQEKVTSSFLVWTQNTQDLNHVNEIKDALVALRSSIESAKDPDELTAFLCYAVMPIVEEIVLRMNPASDANRIILEFEKLGETWYDAIYNYEAPVDTSSEDARYAHMQLAYHYTVYTILFQVLRNRIPLNSDISALFQQILERKNRFEEYKRQFNSLMGLSLESTEKNELLKERQQHQNYIYSVLSETIAAIAWMNEFLNSRHMFDLKRGLIEIQEKQKQFNNLYAVLSSKTIPENFYLECLMQEHCLIELSNLVTTLNWVNDQMRDNIENNIFYFQNEISAEISSSIDNLSKYRIHTEAKDFLVKLKEQAMRFDTISDIAEFRTKIEAKLNELLLKNQSTIVSEARTARRLFRSLSIELHRSSSASSWNEVKNLLLSLLEKVPRIIDDESQKMALEKAKDLDRFGLRDSYSLAEQASMGFRLSHEADLDYAILNAEKLSYRRNSNDNSESSRGKKKSAITCVLSYFSHSRKQPVEEIIPCDSFSIRKSE